MNLSTEAAIFAESFLVYTLLREFDVKATGDLAKRVDLQRHEINPTITWLAKKVGLKNALRVTWLVVAFGVATADVYINQSFTYLIPIFALTVGFGHVLAAANNKHIAYLVDRLGVDEFERQHELDMRELAGLGWGGKVRFLFRTNPTSILVLLFTIPLVSALGYSMVATETFTAVTTAWPAKALTIPLDMAFCFVLAFFLIQFAMALGPFILASRYEHSIKGDSPSAPEHRLPHLEMSASVKAQALENTKREGIDATRIAIPAPLQDES